jgi:hypothetical protein
LPATAGTLSALPAPKYMYNTESWAGADWDGRISGFQRLGSRREGAEKPSSDGRAEAVSEGLTRGLIGRERRGH